MDNFEQVSLFDFDDDTFVAELDGFTLHQEAAKRDGFEYKVYDPYGVLAAKWVSTKDCLELPVTELKRSPNYQIFTKVVRQEKDKAARAQSRQIAASREARADLADLQTDREARLVQYAEPEKTQEELDELFNSLNKSDTLVVHCADRSTDMLSQIYAGKNWDVIRDGKIDKRVLHRLLESHDRLVCLGHGTSGGLINVQGGGSIIGADEAPLLRGKKLFVIWCNADAYFTRHGIGNGQFITGNMPSEVWECRAAGCGTISAQLMLENITYWSKLCADVVERALNGDASGAVKYIRDKYIEKYGDHRVTIYNAERTKVQGKPLEDLSDEYWGDDDEMKTAYTGFNFNQGSVIHSNQYPAANNNHQDPARSPKYVHGKYVELVPPSALDLTEASRREYIDIVEEILTQYYDMDEILYWGDVIDGLGEQLLRVHTIDDQDEYFEWDEEGINLRPC